MSATSPDQDAAAGAPAVYDPLALCIYTTVALLAWIFGPLAVLAFAGIGLAGYVQARRRGLTTSRCYLRDTRLVIAYLAVIGLAAIVAVGWRLVGWWG